MAATACVMHLYIHIYMYVELICTKLRAYISINIRFIDNTVLMGKYHMFIALFESEKMCTTELFGRMKGDGGGGGVSLAVSIL